MFLGILILAGALGTLSRYSLSHFQLEMSFPWLNLTINILGSALMGASFVFLQRYPQAPGLLAFQIGFLGAFTTYSAFSLDVLKLLQAGRMTHGFLYFLMTPALCVAACGASYFLFFYLNQKYFSV